MELTEKTLFQQLSIAIVTLVAFAINTLIGIGIMMKGWGVTEPKSWGWIIGGAIVVSLVTWGMTASMGLLYGAKDA